MQRVKTWQLVVLLIFMSFVSATFLRLNNIGMVERREAVINADSIGDDEITQVRLYDLQRYVSAHMNTNMGKGVYLESAYNRDYNTLLEKVSNDSNSNGNIYKKAQEICAPQFSVYSSSYLQCTLNELAKYPASSNLIDSVSLSPNTYLHAFYSPLWSSDFAGWSLLVCAVILIMIIARLISVGILKLLLNQHYKSI
ncbi:MAG TPA: hypothetical protein VFD55_02285 [Candidatus Angelobacter sp.]|nr:hypothetical protein [Candidatus Angelobacter sp.]